MGVVAFAKSLADEVGRDGILVNNVCPGSILSERMLSNVTAPGKELVWQWGGLAQRAAETAVGRIGEPRSCVSGGGSWLGQVQLHHWHEQSWLMEGSCARCYRATLQRGRTAASLGASAGP